jgi:hypothetical protein
MTSPESALHVEVVDDEIVVSLPESQYSVTYYKPKTSPQLRAKHITENARGCLCRLVLPHALRPTRASPAQCSLPILFLRRLKVQRLDGHHLDGGSRLCRHENYRRNSMVSRKR